VGEEGRNDPNIVCIYELKKKQKLFKWNVAFYTYTLGTI
jgi:hypothetical protein